MNIDATVHRLFDKLDKLIDATQYRQNSKNIRDMKAVLKAADVTGVTDAVDLGAPPLGTIWNIQILSTECTGAGAVASLYVEAVTPLHKKDTFNGAANMSRNYGSAPPVVNHQSRVFVVFTGATAGNACYAVIQIEQLTMPAAHSVSATENDRTDLYQGLDAPDPAPHGTAGTGQQIQESTHEDDRSGVSKIFSRERRDKVAR